jgi:hypothetical protein
MLAEQSRHDSAWAAEWHGKAEGCKLIVLTFPSVFGKGGVEPANLGLAWSERLDPTLLVHEMRTEVESLPELPRLDTMKQLYAAHHRFWPSSRSQ